MKRGVIDVLRRGLDNTVANWPLILIRLGESILFGILAVAAVLAIVVPIIVSVGIQLSDLRTPDEIFGAMTTLFNRWMILVWIFALVSALFLLFIAIHSFVEAGCARVYVDGERIAGPEMDGLRGRYRVFSMDRWLAGGMSGWWTIFWIYNIAWGIGGLVLLVPLVPTIALMLVFRDQAPAVVATGCIGLLLTLMLLLILAIVVGMWTNRSIAGWAVRREGASDALAAGWAAVKSDPGRHLLIAIAMLVVAMAGSTFFAGFGFFAAFGEAFGGGDDLLPMFTLPLRMAGSFFSSIFSAAVSSWFLASYAAIAVETQRRTA